MINNLRLAIDATPDLKSQKIVIGAGVSGCEAFRQRSESKTINILLAWQWLEEMKNLSQGTIIITPEHAVDENFQSIKQKATLIKISGVLHSKNANNIEKENTKLIDPTTELIVMVAGDTQQQDGKWVLYTPQMASELIKELPIDKKILFLNSPRTGKHKIIAGASTVDKMAHRTKTDDVTQFIINTGLDKPWKTVDFKFGQASLWGSALKFCLENSKTVMVLPGESTSMISEALTLGIRPVIYKHKALTKTSEKYIATLIKQDRVILYPKLPTEGNTRQTPIQPQENKIIQTLFMILKDERKFAR